MLTLLLLGLSQPVALACDAGHGPGHGPSICLGPPGQSTVGDACTVATIPDSWPEGVVVDYHDKLIYITGPAAGPLDGEPPSWVHVYDYRTGNRLTKIELVCEDTELDHAAVEGALDDEGNLYMNTTQCGVMKFERPNKHELVWVETNYSGGPAPMPTPPEVLPPIPGLPPSMPNGMAFGPNGELYVADSIQGVLSMIPPGGGSWIPMIVDPVSFGIFSGGTGMNGVKLDPARQNIYFSVTGGAAVDGKIYRVPVDFSSDPELVYNYGPGMLPDGLGFTNTGKLYVVLAGSGLVSVLDDLDVQAYQADLITLTGVDVPPTQPSTIALDPRHGIALMVNHALYAAPVGSPVPDPSPFVLYEFYTGERGDALP